MNYITCPHCGETYPDFDAAHVCSKGPHAPKFTPTFSDRDDDTIQNLLGQALDQAVPYTWTRLDRQEAERVVRCFAELLVKECVQTLVDNTPERYTNESAEEDWDKGYDRAMRDCVHHIQEHFGIK